MNATVLQCGGPTPVINATLAAVIATTQRLSPASRLFGARNSFTGLVAGDLVDLTDLSSAELQAIAHQPAAALGSGRDRPTAEQLEQVIATLDARDIRQVYLIGGNGTMAAALALQQACESANPTSPIQIIGIPKTIDNDLPCTDICPGYGSAARFIAHTVRDAALDLLSMRNFDDVVIYETMGRHTGWLAAASAMARWNPDSPPHFILLPEVPLDENAFLKSVHEQHAQSGVCFVVMAEGVRDTAGVFLAAKGDQLQYDNSGQSLLSLASGAGAYLASRVRSQLGLRCRLIRPDTLQRSTSACVSRLDLQLAQLVGERAVHAAITDGAQGVAIILKRNKLDWETQNLPFEHIHSQPRCLPPEFISASGYFITDRYAQYIRPFLESGPTPLLF